jgi:pseudouridine-5'-phosphate glycosidase
MTWDDILILSDEVRRAHDAGGAIVALESTLISHGLPYPANLETAIEAESAVRAAGALPATIAVLDGTIRVGVTRQELERLVHGGDVFKATARDLPWLVARRQTAATTVAATLVVAHRAGIPIMATGGIGGVHRGASETWDVSADLVQLARTPVAVVCSGAKSILDLPRTLEFLETHGVPVIGYQTTELPAFFAVSSGLRLECRVDDAVEAAAVLRAAGSMRFPAGVLFANPPPAESAIPAGELDALTRRAIEAAQVGNIGGKSLTPFLLDQLRSLGGDRVLAANRALIVRNARVAAKIAVAVRSLAD